MKTILSYLINNNIDISTSNENEVKKILKETKERLEDAHDSLNLPLTEEQCGYYEDVFRACNEDIIIIEEFMKIK